MSRQSRSKVSTPAFLTGEQRINKLLAAAGLGSRRQVDELIKEGRVEIDGEVISQVGIKVNADTAKIQVDGEPLKRHRPVYYAVHKPAGVLCTNRDPEGRPRVIDLVPAQARLFPVGRLDASSTGLILLTNDGELAQLLAHPKHGVPKSYFVVVAGQVDRDAMRRLQRGIYLAEGIARVDGASIRRVRKGCTEIDITLSEGKNREIRRVLARLGHKVVVLRRVAIGTLRLADMPEGSYRPLQEKEVVALYQAVEDLKKARNQERKERRKRSLESKAPNGTKVGPKVARQVFDEENEDWDSGDSVQASEMLESLPPIHLNPFKTEEDDDDDSTFNDAILIDESSTGSYSTKQGSVLGFEEEPSSPSKAAQRRNRSSQGSRHTPRQSTGQRSNGNHQSRRRGSPNPRTSAPAEQEEQNSLNSRRPKRGFGRKFRPGTRSRLESSSESTTANSRSSPRAKSSNLQKTDSLRKRSPSTKGVRSSDGSGWKGKSMDRRDSKPSSGTRTNRNTKGFRKSSDRGSSRSR